MLSLGSQRDPFVQCPRCLVSHTLLGAGLGLLFPLAGSLVQARILSLAPTLAGLLEAQKSSPLLWIIDSAPLVLGLAGYLAGLRQLRIEHFNQVLEEKVKERTLELEAAMRNMDREIQDRKRMEEEVRQACRIEMRSVETNRTEVPPAEEEEAGAGNPVVIPKGTRVLLVDDNKINQKVGALMLRKLGCSVFLAGDGREAVELLETDPFDIVLMDCHMPVVDGFDATRRVRAGAGPNRRLPILALTASTQKADQQLCYDAGMNDHIAKPVKSDVLAERLGHWLKKRVAVEE